VEKVGCAIVFNPVQALDYAAWLAKQFRAAIHLVHVYPPDEVSSVPGAGHLLLQSAEAIERLNEELADVHRKHVPTYCPENCHAGGGRPYQEIINLAREIEADLVRHAPCSVLVVPSHPKIRAATLAGSAGRKAKALLSQQQPPRLPRGKARTKRDRKLAVQAFPGRLRA